MAIHACKLWLGSLRTDITMGTDSKTQLHYRTKPCKHYVYYNLYCFLRRDHWPKEDALDSQHFYCPAHEHGHLHRKCAHIAYGALVRSSLHAVQQNISCQVSWTIVSF